VLSLALIMMMSSYYFDLYNLLSTRDQLASLSHWEQELQLPRSRNADRGAIEARNGEASRRNDED